VFTDKKKELRWILFALLILTLYLSPLFILQENAHIRVHDNLDSNLAWYKVLAKSGQMFGDVDAVIPQIINGVPRNAFGTEYSIIVWLYAWFPTMIAYGLSQALTRVVAFIGMYLLLKKHLLPPLLNTYKNDLFNVSTFISLFLFFINTLFSLQMLVIFITK